MRTTPKYNLCNLIISVEFKWQDYDEPETASVSLYNTEEDIRRLEAIAKEKPELFPAIKVFAGQDVYIRISEIVLEVSLSKIGWEGFILLSGKVCVKYANHVVANTA